MNNSIIEIKPRAAAYEILQLPDGKFMLGMYPPNPREGKMPIGVFNTFDEAKEGMRRAITPLKYEFDKYGKEM